MSFRLTAALLLAASLVPLIACTAPARLRTETRYDYGAVFLLPGIEGQSGWTRDVAIGLEEGGVSSAIEVYDWTTGLPGGFLFNLMDFERNRREAQKLVDRIVAYQDDHPGRPVHVIGYSGGGGVAVLDAIRAQDYMVLTARPSLSRLRKGGLFLSTWLSWKMGLGLGLPGSAHTGARQ